MGVSVAALGVGLAADVFVNSKMKEKQLKDKDQHKGLNIAYGAIMCPAIVTLSTKALQATKFITQKIKTKDHATLALAAAVAGGFSAFMMNKSAK